ncbi:MAG: hypothetical protein EOP54_20285 [Sphingobacteriales bacterium]|nr:MAG: hypothetical protein EOP54_20285 [Sphingobacteriales bacterium]
MYNKPEEKVKGGRKAKEKKEKVVKADTKEVSLEMHRKGISIEDIAKQRDMTAGTIEGHLAHFIAKQELDATEILSKKKLQAIAQVIKKNKTTALNEIRKELPDCTFGEIKIGLAAYLAEGV